MPDGSYTVEGVDAGAAPGEGSEPLIRNLAETAAFFRRSVPTVRGWIADGAPVVEGGSNGVAYALDLRAVAAWLEERGAAERAAAEERAAEDKQFALEIFGDDLLRPDGAREGMSPRAIRELADAQKHLMMVELQRGRLVKADDMALAITSAFRRLADRLAMVPDALQRDHGLAPELATVVSDAIDDGLNDLADEFERELGADLSGDPAALASLAEAAE